MFAARGAHRGQFVTPQAVHAAVAAGIGRRPKPWLGAARADRTEVYAGCLLLGHDPIMAYREDASDGWSAACGSVEAEDSDDRVVDCPQFFGAETTDPAPETLHVDGAELFDQHSRGIAGDVHHRANRCRPGTSRRRRDQYHRARQQRVGLHDHAVALALLFVPEPLGDLESVDVTPLHASTP